MAQALRTHPHYRAPVRRAARPAPRRPTLKKGSRGGAVVEAPALAQPARRRGLRARDARRRQALPAAPGAHGRRRRRARHLGRAAARAPRRHAPHLLRAAVRSRGGAVQRLQRALGIAADGVFGPATQAAVKRFQRSRGLTADGDRRPRHLGRARPRRRRDRAQAPAAQRGSAGGAPETVRRIIAAGDRIAGMPYKYGGGHGQWNDSGYDCSGSVSYALHGAGLLSSALTSGGFMSLGRAGQGPLGHDLRQPRPRLHGRQRAPLRHHRPRRERLALAVALALLGGLHGAPPAGPLGALKPTGSRRSDVTTASHP